MGKRTKARWLASCMAAVTVLGSAGVPAAAKEAEQPAAAASGERSFVPDAKADKGNFNTGWKFSLGDTAGAEQKEFDDSQWEDIQIPHDFSMDQEFSAQYEAESGFLPGGTGWYRKTVVFPGDYEGKTLTLNFDGVYNHAYVYVNGTKIGENFYGYNDFSLDITDYVTCDGKTENVISVKAVNEFPSSRWYSGSGIYRDVTLTVSGDIHVADEGTYVTTPDLETEQGGDVTVHVETDVRNERKESGTVTVRTTVLDSNGNKVSKSSAEKEVSVEADTEQTVEQEVKVNKPDLWDCDNPNLYYVQTEILEGDDVIDTYETEFGFRYLEYSADFGFKLNGENVKMKGVCMHHDQGALGAASYYDAVKRQVEILKGMGVNAIRASHNVPSDMLISICNEEGILVMNEIFDGWTEYKNGNTNDFGKEFNKKLAADNQVIGGSEDKTWAQFALESTVNRDKNDPCVVMWSIGNELPTGCTGEGATVAQATYPDIAADLIKWIQDIDDTKPITMGDNQPTWGQNDFRTNIDNQLAAANGVVGLNYYPTQYESKHNQQPTWPLVGTETASPANSRGIYNTLSSSSQLGDYQCTAYDTACVGWGNTARESWYYTIKNDFIMGEFIWTGFDYIGEPTGTGAWNGTGTGSVVGGDQAVPNSSFFGVIDTAGFPKDSYYFYSSQWVEDKTTLHVVPQSWNEEDLTISSGKVPVYIYSNAAKVELYLNDVKIGTATRNDFKTDAGYTYSTYTNTSDNAELCTAVNENQEWKRMAAQFSVQYEEGTLRAKAYDSNGELIDDTYGLDYVTTNSDEGSSLKVTAEKSEIQADGSSLSYISVDVLDGNGEFVSSARNNIRFSLTGNGEIVGVDNGNPSTTDKFQQPTVLTGEKSANIDAFSGKALVIVKSTDKAGGFTLRAESSGLEGGAVTVNTVGDKQGPAYVKDYEITKEYTVTMGTAPELQTEVNVTMSDDSSVKGTIEWEEVSEDIYNSPGEYMLNGVLTVGEEQINVEAFLHVLPVFAGFENYSRATSTGVVPALPATVSGILENGDIYGEYPVEWEEITADDLQEVGDVITVMGTVNVSEDTSYKVHATVRVAEGETMEPVNVAPQYASLTESCGVTADNLLSIVNGTKNVVNDPNERWTNWNDHLQSSSPFITFTWDEAKEIDTIRLWFFTDANVSVPADVNIQVAEDGVDFRDVGFTETEYSADGETTFTLDAPRSVKGVRITMTQQGNGYVGLKEAEIWTTAFGYTMNNTAVLDSLTVDGKEVDGFAAGEVNTDGYTAETEDPANAVITAESRGNAAVTVVPADESGEAKVIVKSENQLVTNEYIIRLNGESSQKEEAPATQEAPVTEITYEEIAQSVMAADCSATSFKAPVLYNDGGPELAFDGNQGSAWHISYSEDGNGNLVDSASLPQSIEFGLGGEQLVGKLSFEGKTPVGHNGFLKDAEVWAKSGDGEWEKVTDFSFEESAKGNGEVIFDEPVTTDRIRITVTDSYNEIAHKLACIAEIHVYRAILPEPFGINVSMDWQDGNNSDNDRPDSVEVGLKVDGKVIEDLTLTLSEDNVWTDAFENIDPEMGTAFEVYSITEDFDSSKEQEGYLYECAGSVEEGFTVRAVRSVVLNTEARWIDNDNASGKRPDTVSLIFKGGSQEEIVNVTSSHVLPDTVEADLVVPKYQEDGTLYAYTASGGAYSDTEWLIDRNVTASEDGVYIVNYRLEDEEPGEDITTTELEDALKRAAEISEEDVIPSAADKFEAFEEAKTNAQELLDKVNEGDTSVTQEQIDEIGKALTDAMDALPMKADKAALQELVNQAEEIDTGKYTEDSAAVFNEALEGAVKILKDENISAADQAAVDAAEEQLKTAIAGLVEEQPEPEVDKDKLFDLLEQYGGYRSSDYTTETWEPFKAAYDAAKAVYLDESATQEEVDAATAELTRTGKALVKASEPTVPSDGNEETTEKPPVTAVKTGDTGNMAVLWAMLLAVSAGTCIYVKKRKTQ